MLDDNTKNQRSSQLLDSKNFSHIAVFLFGLCEFSAISSIAAFFLQELIPDETLILPDKPRKHSICDPAGTHGF